MHQRIILLLEHFHALYLGICLEIHYEKKLTKNIRPTDILQYLVNIVKFTKYLVKFMFSKKATKIDEIFTVDLTVTTSCQIDGEDFVNFCGFLRKHEL